MKNSIAVVIVALLIVVNGAIGVMHFQASNQISDDQAKITQIASANTSMESDLATLQAQRAQVETALAALRDSVAKVSSQAATSQAKYGNITAALNPMVVKINATGTGLRGYSSGVIVSANGYVLTVLHSIDGARSITVTLSTDEKLPATIIATDAAANLALIKITSPRTDFTAAPRGKMSDLLPGQTVISGGFPMSNELTGPVTFTLGIVSALRTGADFYFIQSDADIAPGSGGGGLFTLAGKLVGIASQTEAGEGLYDYIPADAAATLLKNANIA